MYCKKNRLEVNGFQKDIALKHESKNGDKMKLLKSFTHDEIKGKELSKIYKRTTARGIIMKEDEVLLIFTKRYNDFSFPGGGVDPNESLEDGLLRELNEETGAQNVSVGAGFGKFEELSPIHYPEYDAMEQTSYYFLCTCDKELGQASPEDYETKNGSAPVWVKLEVALEHNKRVIKGKESSIGKTIHRDTMIMEMLLKKEDNLID